MSSRWSYLWSITALLMLWQVGAWWAGEDVLVGPIVVMSKLASEAQTGLFWKHVGASSFRILAALAVAFVTAVPLGLALGSSRRADKFARPLIYLTYPVPKIVLLPLVLLIFGLGDIGKIVMLWLILFFQLLITTRDAARGISRAARYSLYSLGGSRNGSICPCRLALQLACGFYRPSHSDRHCGRGSVFCGIHRDQVRNGFLHNRRLGKSGYPADIRRNRRAGGYGCGSL